MNCNVFFDFKEFEIQFRFKLNYTSDTILIIIKFYFVITTTEMVESTEQIIAD